MKKAVARFLLIAILFSVLMAFSLVGIIVFAIMDKTFLMFVSIGIFAIGFYGVPFLWMHFVKLKQSKKVFNAIKLDGLSTLEDISLQTSIDRKRVSSFISYLIGKRYLAGLFFDGAKLTVRNRGEKLNEFICPSCGAKAMEKKGDHLECPYCGYRTECRK